MNILDVIIVTPILFGFVFGLFKGLIKELMSLAAVFLGIFGARLFEPQVSGLLISWFDNAQPGVIQAISYLLIFIVIVVLLLLVTNVLDKLFSAIALGGLNKFLGGLFGALKFALLVSVFLNVFDTFDKRFAFVKKETKDNSVTYDSMMSFGPSLWKEAKVVLFEPEDED